MKKYLCSFITLFIVANAFADYTYNTNTSNVETFNDYRVFVKEGVEVSAKGSGNIKTQGLGPTYLYNSGTINGTIDTNGYNLFVYNTGTISGGITTVNGGNIIQIVQSNAEMTHFDVIGGNYQVRINGVQNIDFGVINDINANTFYIKNSTIIVNNLSDLETWSQNVELEGPVCLIVKNIDSDNSEITIDNISFGIDKLDVQFTNINSTHAVTKEYKAGSLIITTERVTDSNLIYKSGDNKAEGDVLEQIRNNNKNDKLIDALDNATDLNDINNIKNKSYRFNHGILLRPIKMLNNITIVNPVNEDEGVGINTFYVFSNTIKDFGGDVYVGHRYEDLYLNLGLNINSFTYENNLNEFSGLSYGLNIKAKQKLNDFWLDGITGVALTKYKADYITDDNTIKKDPLALSGYGKTSFGYDFNLMTGFVLSPFVGVSYQRYHVADINDTDLNVFSGGNIKYSFDTDGIKYEYSVNASVTNNGELASTIKVGFLSITDGAGASFDAGVFKNEEECYYKLSINAKIIF